MTGLEAILLVGASTVLMLLGACFVPAQHGAERARCITQLQRAAGVRDPAVPVAGRGDGTP